MIQIIMAAAAGHFITKVVSPAAVDLLFRGPTDTTVVDLVPIIHIRRVVATGESTASPVRVAVLAALFLADRITTAVALVPTIFTAKLVATLRRVTWLSRDGGAATENRTIQRTTEVVALRFTH